MAFLACFRRVYSTDTQRFRGHLHYLACSLVGLVEGGVHEKSVQSHSDFIRFDTLSPYSPYSYHK